MFGAIAAHYVDGPAGGGGITFVGGRSGRTSLTNTTLNLSLPTGLQVGDRMLLVGCRVATGSQSISGWTQLGTLQSGSGGSFATRAALWTRVATSGDIGGSVSHNGNDGHLSLSVVAYRGVSAVHASSQAGSSSASATITAPTLTTTLDDCLLVRLFAMYAGSGAAINPNDPLTDRTATASGPNAATAVGDQLQASAGAAGTRSATATLSTSWAAFTVALAA